VVVVVVVAHDLVDHVPVDHVLAVDDHDLVVVTDWYQERQTHPAKAANL